jgi:hypothetical protein
MMSSAFAPTVAGKHGSQWFSFPTWSVADAATDVAINPMLVA